MGRRIYVALIIAIAALLVFNSYFSFTSSQAYSEPWWNASWHYRIKVAVNTSGLERTDWPVEIAFNFTQLLENVSIKGTFDENSTRVLEINASGDVVQEMKSQFDKAIGYSAASNAIGDVVFLLNGTVPKETTKQFYIYYDIIENTKKQYPNYTSELNAGWDGEEATINTTSFVYKIDTLRNQNTSGIYSILGWNSILESYTNLITPSGVNDKTREYIQLTNGSSNLTYDLRYNGTLIAGPVRITFRQEGDEAYWNTVDLKTGKTHLLKEYVFYYNQSHSWIRTNISNTDSAQVYRNSTPAGAIMYESGSATFFIESNSTEPSLVMGTGGLSQGGVGFINFNQTGTDNFNASSDAGMKRVGINLKNTTIPVNSVITHSAAMILHITNNTIDFWEEYKKGIVDSVKVVIGESERFVVRVSTATNFNNVTWPVTIVNRNESLLITANITFDPWKLNSTVNVTVDNGTATTSDDTNVTLYDDGTHGDKTAYDSVFTGYYNLTNMSSLGFWNITTLVYSKDNYPLNQTLMNITVTNQLNVSTTINNPTGLGNRNVTVTVKVQNYRRDNGITGILLNCTVRGQQLSQSNISDSNNGTYYAWFDAPADFGTYTINCTAAKDGNNGYEQDEFTVESATTEVTMNNSIMLYTASNVGFYMNESFELFINLSNIGNSSAYNTNFTLQLSSGLASNTTFVNCGDIYIGYSCSRAFNITVLNNTAPGYYYINVTVNWRNFVGTSEQNSTTNTTINVTPNPLLSVPQDFMHQPVPPGNESVVSSIIVSSTGNTPITGVGFTAYGYDSNFTFEFTPSTIASLTNGQSSSVQVNVTIDQYQLPGIYNGTINVTTTNDGYKIINLSLTVTGTNVSITRTPAEYTTSQITRYRSQNFDVFLNSTNIGNSTAFYSSINISLPSGWLSNVSSVGCGNISRGNSCAGTFNVTIPNLTASGYYDVNFTVQWDNVGIARVYNTTTVNVTVVSNVTMELDRNLIESTVNHSTEKTIGNFTIRSTGNDKIVNVTLNLTGLADFNPEINSTSGFNLSAGSDRTVEINVTIPSGHAPGVYTATLNITTNISGYSIVNLSVTVPVNGSWYMNQTGCLRSQQPASGVVCSVKITNLGNVNITFNVTPGANNYSNHSNYTWLETVNFTVANWSIREITVYYNVTLVQGTADFYQNYTFNATHPSAFPAILNLTIELGRYIPSQVAIYTTANITQQRGSISIGAVVTSISGATITQVIANVTRPNGQYSTYNMNNFGSGSGGKTYWDFVWHNSPQLPYPGTWGNTSLSGNYTINITAYDSQNINSSSAQTLQVYPMFLTTISIPVIQQGELQNFYYKAHEYNMIGFPSVWVNVSLFDPDGNEVYIFTGNQYQANTKGEVTKDLYVLPHREFSNYTYTLYTNSSYYYAPSSMWIYNETYYRFEAKTSEDLKAKVSIPYNVYRNYVMPITVLTYNDTGPTDPDNFSVKLYLYTGLPSPQYWKEISMSSFTKQSVGVYVYSENIGSLQTTGTYIAVLNASRKNVNTLDMASFRIASGGPYDVGFNSLDKEVSPAEFINFQMFVENKGEVDHDDVQIEYWISDATQTWDHNMFSAQIMAGENKTFDEELYIYTAQPPGTYTLNLRVTYDPTQPSAVANTTFKVTGEAPVTPVSPGGGGEGGAGGAAPPAKRLKILEFPAEISAVIGTATFVDLKIQATDNATNVTPSFSGVFEEWFVSDPRVKASMSRNETSIFTLKLLVPPGTKTGEYRGKVTVDAKEPNSKDEKAFIILVFTSKKELIEYEIAKIKGSVKELEFKVNQARETKSLAVVDKAINDTWDRIAEAEGYFESERYDSALNSIYKAWEQLRIAEDLFSKAPPPSLMEGIPWWFVLLIIVLVVVVALLIFFLRRTSLDLRTMVGARASEARGIAKMTQKEMERNTLRAEKDKAERVLALLETQFRSGILSQEAYNTLKTKQEQKIRDMDERLRQAY
jgi:uncharacterized membrane protein